jgi:UDP-glucose 4-epimerase
MKRVKRITSKNYHGDVEVTVRVSNTYALTKDEVDRAITDLADSSMNAINGLRYFNTPLSKIQVT